MNIVAVKQFFWYRIAFGILRKTPGELFDGVIVHDTVRIFLTD